jgi:cytochrome b involved in lipid metabolism
MDNHPGGSAILMNALGIDASHLFSGGSDIYKSSDASYSESRTDIHIHSRFAQYILSKMAVGKVSNIIYILKPTF